MPNREQPSLPNPVQGSQLLACLLDPSYRPDEGIGREPYLEQREKLIRSLYPKDIPGRGSFYTTIPQTLAELTDAGVFNLSLGFPLGTDLAYELAAIGYEVEDMEKLRFLNPRIVAVVKAKYPGVVRSSCPNEEMGRQFEKLYELGIACATGRVPQIRRLVPDVFYSVNIPEDL